MAKLANEPGHGRNTWPPSKGINASGGVPGMAEHDFNAAVTDEVNRLLSGKLATFSAQPSHGNDVSLSTRIHKYNVEYRKDKSMIGYSHHGNANANKNTKGFGVFYWHTSVDGKKLAQKILAAYKKEFPGLPIWGDGIFASRKGDWTNFAILRDTAAPFVLIEWDFFTNDEARKRMLSTDYRKRCAKVAASVACEWYGIPFNVAATPAVAKPAAKPSTVRDYLLLNDTGAKVKTLQSHLDKLGYSLSVDGIYGKATENAVKAFQLANGLVVDGVAGKATLSLLEARVMKLNKPKEEEDMLKQAIVIGSLNDYAAAEILSVRKGIPIYPRNAIKDEVAKELIVVGGNVKGLKAEKITNLAGKDRFETAEKVEAYLKK